MSLPNLDQTIETFIKVSLNNQISEEEYWHTYIEILYEKLIPLLDNLRDQNLINSFSFLIHNKDNGVPTTKDDINPYIHLRLGLPQNISLDDLKLNLPDYCLFTQKCAIESPYTISGIDSEYLIAEDFRYAWQILSSCSELVVDILKIHKDKKLPIQHVAQFLHFLGNQFFVKLIGIPTP